MIINTDYEVLRMHLNTLKNRMENYRAHFNEVYGLMNTHSGWIGKDSEKYREQADILKENIEKMIRNINALAQDVDNGAALYRKAADTVSPHASKF